MLGAQHDADFDVCRCPPYGAHLPVLTGWILGAQHDADVTFNVCRCPYRNRRAYQRYRERQRLQKEDDKRTIETLNTRLNALEIERADLAQRVELLQKVSRRAEHVLPSKSACDLVQLGGRLCADLTASRSCSPCTISVALCITCGANVRTINLLLHLRDGGTSRQQ